MGFINRFLSMLFLITFPVKLIMWSLVIMFIFCIIAIKSLISNSGYYNVIKLNNYIDEQNDGFLQHVCEESGFINCMMVVSVFSKDGSNIIHSYSKSANTRKENALDNIPHQSIIPVDKDLLENTNLQTLQRLKDGCIELERTTKDLVKFYNLDTDTVFTHSYICFKRNTYFALFTQGHHCETCGVRLNEYFKQMSNIIYYGDSNSFFDKTSKLFYEWIGGFFSSRVSKIKGFFINSFKKSVKTVGDYLSNTATEEDKSEIIEKQINNNSNSRRNQDIPQNKKQYNNYDEEDNLIDTDSLNKNNKNSKDRNKKQTGYNENNNNNYYDNDFRNKDSFKKNKNNNDIDRKEPKSKYKDNNYNNKQLYDDMQDNIEELASNNSYMPSDGE